MSEAASAQSVLAASVQDFQQWCASSIQGDHSFTGCDNDGLDCDFGAHLGTKPVLGWDSDPTWCNLSWC